MNHACRTAILVALAAGLSGCLGFSSADPYPVYGNPVNPTPVPDYVVQCSTAFGPVAPPLGDGVTDCRQTYEPVGGRAVRARS